MAETHFEMPPAVDGRCASHFPRGSSESAFTRHRSSGTWTHRYYIYLVYDEHVIAITHAASTPARPGAKAPTKPHQRPLKREKGDSIVLILGMNQPDAIASNSS